MKKNVVVTLCGIALLANACTKVDSKNDLGRGTLMSVTSTGNSAEELAQAGEKLMTPWSFMYADKVFSEALVKDPANKRAQFYKAFLGPIMLNRGIMNRVRPLVAKIGTKEAVEHEKNIANLKGDVAKFLLDGPQDIVDERTAQDHISALGNATNELRSFIKNNKDINLTVSLPKIAAAITSPNYSCHSSSYTSGNSTYYYYNCYSGGNYQTAVVEGTIEATIERADMEVAQNAAAYMQLVPMIYASYDLTGLINMTQQKVNTGKMTDKEIADLLVKFPQFGKIRADQQFGKTLEIGADFVQGLRWVVQNQKTLCPAGEPSESNRPGKAIAQGICLDAKNDNANNSLKKVFDVIRIGSGVLSGPYDVLYTTVSGNQALTVIDVSRYMSNPVQDIRNVMPKQFNSCGNAVGGIADSSFSGLLPNNDLELILTNTGSLGKYCGPKF